MGKRRASDNRNVAPGTGATAPQTTNQRMTISPAPGAQQQQQQRQKQPQQQHQQQQMLTQVVPPTSRTGGFTHSQMQHAAQLSSRYFPGSGSQPQQQMQQQQKPQQQQQQWLQQEQQQQQQQQQHQQQHQQQQRQQQHHHQQWRQRHQHQVIPTLSAAHSSAVGASWGPSPMDVDVQVPTTHKQAMAKAMEEAGAVWAWFISCFDGVVDKSTLFEVYLTFEARRLDAGFLVGFVLHWEGALGKTMPAQFWDEF